MSVRTICSDHCQAVCEGDVAPDLCQYGCMKACNSDIPDEGCYDYCTSQCAAATSPACMGYCLWSKPCPAGLGSEWSGYPKGSFDPKQPKPSREALMSARLPSGVDHPVRRWKAMPIEKFRSSKQKIAAWQVFLIVFAIFVVITIIRIRMASRSHFSASSY